MFNLSQKQTDLLSLHFVVLLFGFTGVLGKLIDLPALPLVAMRLVIALIALYSLFPIQKMPLRSTIAMLGNGLLIGLHWLTFYWAIKLSSVSLTLLCLGVSPLFASVLEPILHKRGFVWWEFALGLVGLMGLSLLVEDPVFKLEGVIVGLSSSFFTTLFSVLNGKLASRFPAVSIAQVELTGALILIGGLFIAFPNLTGPVITPISMENGFFQSDWFWLILLGLLGTTFAFVVSVQVLRSVTPFTSVLTINLEPVYGIAASYFIFPESERMGWRFFMVLAIILSAVIVNGLLRAKMTNSTPLLERS